MSSFGHEIGMNPDGIWFLFLTITPHTDIIYLEFELRDDLIFL